LANSDGLCDAALTVVFDVTPGLCIDTKFTKEVFNCWVITLSSRLSGLMARCWFYYVLALTLQFVFIVLLGLVFMGRHKCEAVACLSSQVICNFYELFIVHFNYGESSFYLKSGNMAHKHKQETYKLTDREYK